MRPPVNGTLTHCMMMLFEKKMAVHVDEMWLDDEKVHDAYRNRDRPGKKPFTNLKSLTYEYNKSLLSGREELPGECWLCHWSSKNPPEHTWQSLFEHLRCAHQLNWYQYQALRGKNWAKCNGRLNTFQCILCPAILPHKKAQIRGHLRERHDVSAKTYKQKLLEHHQGEDPPLRKIPIAQSYSPSSTKLVLKICNAPVNYIRNLHDDNDDDDKTEGDDEREEEELNNGLKISNVKSLNSDWCEDINGGGCSKTGAKTAISSTIMTECSLGKKRKSDSNPILIKKKRRKRHNNANSSISWANRCLYQCGKCSKYYKSETDLNRHGSKHHHGYKVATCLV